MGFGAEGLGSRARVQDLALTGFGFRIPTWVGIFSGIESCLGKSNSSGRI